VLVGKEAMKVTGLVPARFLTIISHLILVIVIFWSRVRMSDIYRLIILNVIAEFWLALIY